MSDTDHAVQIQACVRQLNIWIGDLPDDVRDDAQSTVSAIFDHADDLASELAAERARVGRLRMIQYVQDQFATALVDLLTDDQINSTAYPDDLDRQASIMVKECWDCGDLPDDDEGEVTT